MIAYEIAKAVRRALAISDQDDKPLPQSKIEYPSSTEFGDYSTNAALLLARKQSKPPQEVALVLVSQLNQDPRLKQYIAKIEVAGGFINFFLSNGVLLENLNAVLSMNDQYGKSDQFKGKTAIVEYSSPNIAKPFTIGHFRSTIIGDAIANLLVSQGMDVRRDNHLGDWGTQFGKLMCAINKWGNEEEIEKSANPVRDLVALYVKFHEEAEKNPTLKMKLENGLSALKLEISVPGSYGKNALIGHGRSLKLFIKD